MVSTIFKNISQWEGLSHILWKIKHVWNHQPAFKWAVVPSGFFSGLHPTVSAPLLNRCYYRSACRWAAGQIRILNGQTMCNSMLDMLRCYICYHTWGKNAVYISIFIIFYYIPLEALMSQAWLKIRADPAVLHQLRMSLNATTRRIIRIHPS